LNKLISSTAFAAVALCATSASAQVAAAPAGPRIEALVGYDRVKILGEREGGIFGGVGAGYDVAVANNFSLGADVEATLANTDREYLGVNVKAGRDLYAGARASFGLAPTVIGYVKGGYTNARVKAEGFGGENLEGWRVGTGVQFLLNGNSYVGGEYRYSRYDSDFSRHQLALTVGTRFGAAPLAAPAPVVVEAPAPAPAPATQTCADGSVILATDLCPAPAPAPAPAPVGERG
jgi:outer membrane immunogenic protein